MANVHIKSRRAWPRIVDPTSPHRTLDDDALAALQACHNVLTSASFCVSTLQPATMPVYATADAMATTTLAGLGGAAHFPGGTTVWFQVRIQLADAQQTCRSTSPHGNCWPNSPSQFAWNPNFLQDIHLSSVVKEQIIALRTPQLRKGSQ